MNYLGDGWSNLTELKGLLFQRYIFIFYLVLVDQSFQKTEKFSLFSKSIFFPGQLIYPIPTQPYYWLLVDTEINRNRIKGIFDLLICAGFTFLLFELEDWYIKIFQLGPSWLLSSLVEYVGIYLFSCVSISTPVAIGRLLGYSLPSAYRIPFLAASPHERWRRWNTYFYNFYCWFFYLPFLKKTNSVFISITATFAITAFFHSREGNPFNFFSHMGPLHIFNSTFIFFLAHGFVVYLSMLIKSRIWDGKRREGWIGVGVTWICMLVVHSIKLNDWGL